MIKKLIAVILAILAITSAQYYGGGGSGGGDGGGGGGTVNPPSGCAVEECEQLYIEIVEPICSEELATGLKVTVRDSRGMAVEGASVFMSGRFLGLPSRMTDGNGVAVFEGGFIEGQRYVVSASKAGRPGYGDLYGYRSAESKNFVFGEGDILCEESTEPIVTGPGTPDNCITDEVCKEDEICDLETHTCVGLASYANAQYPDGCWMIENRTVTRDPCCDSYELVVERESGLVGEFVPVALLQCNKPVANKEIVVTDPDGESQTLATEESGFGITLTKSGEYTVSYLEATRRVSARAPQADEKSIIALLAEEIGKNIVLVLAILFAFLLFFYYRRRKKEESALSEDKKEGIKRDIEDEKITP